MLNVDIHTVTSFDIATQILMTLWECSGNSRDSFMGNIGDTLYVDLLPSGSVPEVIQYDRSLY